MAIKFDKILDEMREEDSAAIGTAIASATEGSVLFAGSGGVLAQDNANFKWDDGLTLTAPSATDKPLVLKGAASQSANLTEWQNSSSTVLASLGVPVVSGRPTLELRTLVATGGSNAGGILEGFDSTNTRTFAINRVGSLFIKEGASIGTVTGSTYVAAVQYVAGRMQTAQDTWLQSGARLRFYSPDASKNAFIGMNNNGQIDLFGGGASFGQFSLTGSTWVTNLHQLDVNTPAGTPQTHIDSFGNIVIDMKGGSSRNNTATIPLAINIDPYNSGAGTLSVNLTEWTISSVLKAAITDLGAGVFSGINPISSDGASIGTSSIMWSDLFLASGAVINFNAGNATITHSAGLLTSNVDIVVPDEAYGSGWDSSLEVPTKNAVYDKIQSLLTGQTYAASNVVTDRTYDADATTLEELADVVGTLIADLRAVGIVV